jgi:hypothetical protein
MNTTYLFVEIIISGIQCMVWILLFILTLTGADWLNNLSKIDLSNWMVLLSLVGLSFSYTLGIIVDRLGDWMFVAWDRTIQAKYLKGKTQTIASLRHKIDNTSYFKHIEYTRSRLRIVRSSTLNFFMTSIALILFIQKTNFMEASQKFLFSWVSLLAGGALTALSVYSWHTITHSNYKTIIDATKDKS